MSCFRVAASRQRKEHCFGLELERQKVQANGGHCGYTERLDAVDADISNSTHPQKQV